MMDDKTFDVREISPFGPVILEATCPDFIVDALNGYVDEFWDNKSTEFPNLLSRGIKNPFIPNEFAEEIGLVDYMEYLGDCYLDMSKRTKYGTIDEGKEYRYDVTRLPSGVGIMESDFLGRATIDPSIEYIDAWVNIYEESDFTPIHTHGGDLSSVMILQLPEDESGQNKVVNERREDNPNGTLQYYYGIGDTSDIMIDTWSPIQFVGLTLLFPPNLRHAYYPHKLKGKKRRSLSLNFRLEEEN